MSKNFEKINFKNEKLVISLNNNNYPFYFYFHFILIFLINNNNSPVLIFLNQKFNINYSNFLKILIIMVYYLGYDDNMLLIRIQTIYDCWKQSNTLVLNTDENFFFEKNLEIFKIFEFNILNFFIFIQNKHINNNEIKIYFNFYKKNFLDEIFYLENYLNKN